MRPAVPRRVAEGLTEAEIASRMGVTPAEIVQLERETDWWWLGNYVRYARAIGGAPFGERDKVREAERR